MITLFAHGSPDPRHRRDVLRLADDVGGHLDERVVVAFLQHDRPRLAERAAWAWAAQERLDVMPLLLSAGTHNRVDVPAELDQLARSYPGLQFGGVPGLPPADLAPVVQAAVARHVGGAGSPAEASGADHPAEPTGAAPVGPAPVTVVGVAAGSTRPGALAPFAALQRRLATTGIDLELANGADDLTAAIGRLRSRGAGADLVVPLMFADGVLADRAAATARANGIECTGTLGAFRATSRVLAQWLEHSVIRATEPTPGAAA